MPTLLIAIRRLSALLWTSGMASSMGAFMGCSLLGYRRGAGGGRIDIRGRKCNRVALLIQS
jgi:hypothetical protein